jgi:hypothetical protein
MWTLTVLFCSTLEVTACAPSGPTTLFPTEEACHTYFEQNLPRLDLSQATVQYRCVAWGKPT